MLGLDYCKSLRHAANCSNVNVAALGLGIYLFDPIGKLILVSITNSLLFVLLHSWNQSANVLSHVTPVLQIQEVHSLSSNLDFSWQIPTPTQSPSLPCLILGLYAASTATQMASSPVHNPNLQPMQADVLPIICFSSNNVWSVCTARQAPKDTDSSTPPEALHCTIRVV